MATERTFLLLAGQLYPDQAALFPRVNYLRLAIELALICNGTVPSVVPATCDLTLDDVAQGETYTLPVGLKVGENNVNGGDGLNIAAQVRPGVIVTAAGNASDLVAWLTAEVTIEEAAEADWLTLTASHLQSRIAAAEYNAFTAALISSGQSDPVPQLLNHVSERIRQAVRSGGKVALGAAGMIPASLIDCGLSIAKYRLFGRVSSMKRFAELAKDDNDQALDELKAVAKGELVPEAPSTATEDAPTPQPNITERTSDFERGDQDGI